MISTLVEVGLFVAKFLAFALAYFVIGLTTLSIILYVDYEPKYVVGEGVMLVLAVLLWIPSLIFTASFLKEFEEQYPVTFARLKRRFSSTLEEATEVSD